jgi:hypothetical protein
MTETPVIFIIFNRPEHTARVFGQIRRAAPQDLYIISDGPRADHPGEAERVAAVRRMVDKGVDWPCRVRCDYSAVNLGCGRRISSGISAAFAVYDRAIILEDDCVPDDSFFPFCTELLERHAGDLRIGQIGGARMQDTRPADGASYHYSRFTHCWGWATWRRAWSRYDYKVSGNPARLLPRALPSEARRSLSHSLRRIARGRLDTWDYQWTYACMRTGMYSIIPEVNLVTNIGFGGDATHTHAAHPVADRPRQPMQFPLRHPAHVSPDEEADLHTARLLYWRPGLFGRLLRSLRKRL